MRIYIYAFITYLISIDKEPEISIMHVGQVKKRLLQRGNQENQAHFRGAIPGGKIRAVGRVVYASRMTRPYYF